MAEKPMPREEEREPTPLAVDEAADDEYEAHVVGASSGSGSSDLLTLIVAANAMMIWPCLMPWYFWTQLFREFKRECDSTTKRTPTS